MEFCAFYKINSTIITACFHSPIKSHKSLFIKKRSLTQPCPGQGLGYSCISSRREMHRLIVPTSAAGLSEVCTSSLIFHRNQNKPNSWALPLPARACQLLYVLNSLKCSSQSSSLSRTRQCFQHMDLQILRNSTRYHQVRKTAQQTSMLPCKAVISKYLIYAQLPSHEPQHSAFRTKLWQRNLTQCTDLAVSSAHTGNRKEKGGDAQSDAITSPLVSEDFYCCWVSLQLPSPWSQQKCCGGSSGVYVNRVSHFWQDHSHEQVTLKCKIIFPIYFL